MEGIKRRVAALRFLLRGTVLEELASIARRSDDLLVSNVVDSSSSVLTLASAGLDRYVSTAAACHTPFQALRLVTAALSSVGVEKQEPHVAWVLGKAGEELALLRGGGGRTVSWSRHLQPFALKIFSKLHWSMQHALKGTCFLMMLHGFNNRSRPPPHPTASTL